MPDMEKTRLREMAKSFGMTVNELAVYIGYTKQRLYQAVNGGRLHAGHLKLAEEKLNTLNELLYKRAENEAREQYLDRERMIGEFVAQLGKKLMKG